MSESFCSYPLLSNSGFAAVGYVSDCPEFSYSEEYEEFPLQIEGTQNQTGNYNGKIKDPRCTWYPETHNFILKKTCRFTAAYNLFGSKGIAAMNATVGVALRWISTKSDERGIIPFGELLRSDSSKELTANGVFNKGKLKGSLKLQTVLYLKDPGKPNEDEMYFAQQPGTILGVLDQMEFYIDGNGSIFPIAEIDIPGKPLWRVYYSDTADALQDSFTGENVEIQINKAHPSYEALKIESSMSESPLFLEVISSALMVIVEAVKESVGEDWDNILNGEGYDPGSIAEAINYFVTRLQWDVSSPVKLALSIKDFFENRS